MQQNTNLNSLFTKAIQNDVPNMATFEQIANLINQNSKNAYDFVDILVKYLSSQRDPKQQYIVLDLIEYTTCRCNMLLHKLYNEKKFLKLINAIFNQNNLTLLIKEKNLQLITFWKYFFSGKEDILPNFDWYYQNIISRGIDLPPYEPSKYLIKNSQEFQEAVKEEEVQIVQFQQNSKQAKLLKDLNVVKDNIVVANELIDNKEREVASQIVKTLQKMEMKLMQLPDILDKENEQYLYKLTLALIQDIENTKQRYEDLKAKRKPQKFAMSSNSVKQQTPVKKQIKTQDDYQQKQQYFQQIDQFEKSSSQSFNSLNMNSGNKKSTPVQNNDQEMDLLGFDDVQITQFQEQQPSNGLAQQLLHSNNQNNFDDFLQENNSKNTFDFQNNFQQNPQKQNEFNNFVGDFQDFKVSKTDNSSHQNADIDLLGLDSLDTQPQQSQQRKQPQDIFQYNKPLQEKMKKEKVEYDPFPDIDLLQLNNINSNKQKQIK